MGPRLAHDMRMPEQQHESHIGRTRANKFLCVIESVIHILIHRKYVLLYETVRIQSVESTRESYEEIDMPAWFKKLKLCG